MLCCQALTLFSTDAQERRLMIPNGRMKRHSISLEILPPPPPPPPPNDVIVRRFIALLLGHVNFLKFIPCKLNEFIGEKSFQKDGRETKRERERESSRAQVMLVIIVIIIIIIISNSFLLCSWWSDGGIRKCRCAWWLDRQDKREEEDLVYSWTWSEVWREMTRDDERDEMK